MSASPIPESQDGAGATEAASAVFATPEEIIAEARAGRMVILVDNEDRENEGDIVIPADCCGPAEVNFMARFARGLICLAMTRKRVEDLGLPLQPRINRSRFETAFTVSIEAREGVTTGISAADRARTIAVAIDPALGRDHLVTPGHVFPLMARDGGVLVRAGHTEAAVDIARLAGREPAGVICEIMNDDGTMARRPDLIAFAARHGLKIGTIADLIAYRRRHDRTIERGPEGVLDSRYGGRWRMIVYINRVTYAEHVALLMGDVTTPEPVLVRMHALSVMDDVLGHRHAPSGSLEGAMRAIAAEGRGAVVLLREPMPTALSDRLRQVSGFAAGLEVVPPPRSAATADGAGRDLGHADTGHSPKPQLRDYGVGAQILLDLGIREMILLSNTQKTIVGLEGYGLVVAGRRPIPEL